eukprot:726024-Prymnesium_polylepis.3
MGQRELGRCARRDGVRAVPMKDGAVRAGAVRGGAVRNGLMRDRAVQAGVVGVRKSGAKWADARWGGTSWGGVRRGGARLADLSWGLASWGRASQHCRVNVRKAAAPSIITLDQTSQSSAMRSFVCVVRAALITAHPRRERHAARRGEPALPPPQSINEAQRRSWSHVRPRPTTKPGAWLCTR